MAENSMVLPQVWNISSNLCVACQNGDYSQCECNTDTHMNRLYKDLSTDSLDQCHVTPKRKTQSTSSAGSSGFIFDDEFEDDYTKRPLPPSTTDWDSIDSVLENSELDTDDVEKTPVSTRLSSSFHMQMVFVDSDSDKGSLPDVEVYYDDEDILRKHSTGSQGNISFDSERNVESRDSGYVTTDVLDLNIERVTDDTKQRRRTSLEPIEASTRVLTSLKLHEEHELKKQEEDKILKQKQDIYASEIHRKNVEELREMKEMLELRIAKINMELVEELQSRDELHAYHEALMMDADDLKQTQSNPTTPTKVNPTTPTKVKSNKETKRKSFWWR